MNCRHVCCAVLSIGVGLGMSSVVRAQEFGANTSYYEDDAWFDITEWFDGNDYNPTDEAWWRWDDETYQASQDVSGDVDSDNWFGYSARNDDDWFFDYYDPYPYVVDYNDNDGLYDHRTSFYDYDHDGTYDAYGSYGDWDGDGSYEDNDYYIFNNTGTAKQQQAARTNMPKDSRQQSVSGKVEKSKTVQVRGGQKHQVVAIQREQGASVLADLGRVDGSTTIRPKTGDQISVKGPKVQVGKHGIIMARSVESSGKTMQVDRNMRTMTGKVLSTHKAKVRSTEHLLAMVDAKGKDKVHKIAVDLGPADRLNMKLEKGSTLTFTGFPVKVKDRSVILAQSVEQGNQMVQIDRRPNEGAASALSSAR
jgi:hypothetical protein